MAKDIDLDSKQWLDLVFEGKNKKYGAYELRESSSRRHLMAIGVVVIAAVALVFLLKLFHPVKPETVPLKQQTGIEFTIMDNPVVPEKMPVRAVEVVAAASTPTQKTIKFVDPVIVVNTKVNPEDLMATQDDLFRTDAAIGTTTRTEGTSVGVHPDDVVPVPSAPEEAQVFVNPEVWPQPSVDLLKWLSKNIHYPADAVEEGIQGRVILRFVIGPDGSVGNVEVLKKLYPSCDKEAVRVINKMPKWIPGMQSNRAVSVYYTLPVYFRLQN